MSNNKNEIRTWTLEIPYANTAGRNNAKKLGAKWDASRKVWTVETSEYKLDLRNLWKFVVEEKQNDVVESKEIKGYNNVGFPVKTERMAKLVDRYGFDAIEMMG